jgi:hypothetical protein
LQNEHRAAGSADVEGVVTSDQFVGVESDFARAERVSLDVCVANLGRRLESRQVLAHESRSGPLRTDLFDRDRFARDQRKCERRSNNLSAAFAL